MVTLLTLNINALHLGLLTPKLAVKKVPPYESASSIWDPDFIQEIPPIPIGGKGPILISVVA